MSTPIVDLVMVDLAKRKLDGLRHYGKPLTVDPDGRDALWEAYEEGLDLCIYLRQAIEQSRQRSRVGA